MTPIKLPLVHWAHRLRDDQSGLALIEFASSLPVLMVLSMMVLSGLLIWTKRTAQATAAALKRTERAPRTLRSETTVEAHT